MTHPALVGLGVREKRLLVAILDDTAVCPRHGRTQCSCSGGGPNQRAADRSEARQVERDDRATGLSIGQREALLGWLLAQYDHEAIER